jgi:hypothetical protein
MSGKIKVGIHRAIHNKVDPELEVYRKILTHNGIPYIDLDSSDTEFWEKLNGITHFIYKWAHVHSDQQIANAVIPIVQYHRNIKCFPSWETSWHYDDKIKQAYLLKENGFPVCDTFVFYHKSKAMEWVNSTTYPVVFKLKTGSGAYNVKLIHSKSQAKSMVNVMFGKGYNQDKIGFVNRLKTFNYDPTKIFRYYAIKFRNGLIGRDVHPFWAKQKNYILFQKFMPGNGYDTRVQITGDRAFAFIRYNRKNDFRASGSNDWSLDHSKIDMRFVKIAFNVSKKLRFQSMAYDFIYDENKNPAIAEISYCYGDYPEFSTGYWDDNLNWHTGNYVPQYLELMDLLELPDLKQTENVGPGSSYKNVTVK